MRIEYLIKEVMEAWLKGINQRIAKIFNRHGISVEPEKHMPWVFQIDSTLSPILSELLKFDIVEIYCFFKNVLYNRAEYIINACLLQDEEFPPGSTGYMSPGISVIEKENLEFSRERLIHIMKWYSTQTKHVNELITINQDFEISKNSP